ncbi:MAG: FAD-linked oxidase C-terminal domain-containing protein, partial [Dehalococcoidia bacterium]
MFRGEEPRQQGRSFDYLHVALPISKVMDYRRRCDEIFKSYDIRVTEYAIWTEPELFSMLLVPGDRTNLEDIPKAVDQVLMLAQDMGGVMEYCHGVGIKLSHLLAREMGTGLEVVRAVKKALDPHNIMNPGKLAL